MDTSNKNKLAFIRSLAREKFEKSAPPDTAHTHHKAHIRDNESFTLHARRRGARMSCFLLPKYVRR